MLCAYSLGNCGTQSQAFSFGWTIAANASSQIVMSFRVNLLSRQMQQEEKDFIDKLHLYNEMKDLAQELMGKIRTNQNNYTLFTILS